MTDGTDRRRAGSCFIIATRNRHELLVEAVRSVVAQTVLPAELCIVDSSDEPLRPGRDRATLRRRRDRARLRPPRAARPHGPAQHRHRPDDGRPGLPDRRRRHARRERARGDPRRIRAVGARARRRPRGSGASAEPAPPRPSSGAGSSAWEAGGPRGAGGCGPGFFVEGVASSASVRKLEYFNGWFMSFRREVFDRERFDERLAGYAFKEDIDFSYRVVKRGYLLVQTPKALILHHKSPSERLSRFDHQRMALANQFYLHRKNMPQTLHTRQRSGGPWSALCRSTSARWCRRATRAT